MLVSAHKKSTTFCQLIADDWNNFWWHLIFWHVSLYKTFREHFNNSVRRTEKNQSFALLHLTNSISAPHKFTIILVLICGLIVCGTEMTCFCFFFPFYSSADKTPFHWNCEKHVKIFNFCSEGGLSKILLIWKLKLWSRKRNLWAYMWKFIN